MTRFSASIHSPEGQLLLAREGRERSEEKLHGVEILQMAFLSFDLPNPVAGSTARPRAFEYRDQAINVWPMQIKAPADLVKELEQILAPDEKERAARFRFDHLRQSFIVVRGALRILLGYCLDVSPASVQFKFGPQGKPYIASPERVRFNLSHSANLAVFAFTADCEVGIDVERVRKISEMQSIAERTFGLEEAARVMSLPANERARAFFRCWTRKEAYLKAIGEGLSFGASTFQVTETPGRSKGCAHVHAGQDWCSHDLEFEGYIGALGYPGVRRDTFVGPLITASQLKQV